VRLLITTILFGVLILGAIVELLRRRRLREKYAALWLFTGCLVVVLALFPGGLDGVAVFVGVANGASLVLFLAVVFLLIIAMHLSWEISQLEEETRSISEEIALLRMELERSLPATSTPTPDERLGDDPTDRSL
jgi:hypothetical protein